MFGTRASGALSAILSRRGPKEGGAPPACLCHPRAVSRTGLSVAGVPGNGLEYFPGTPRVALSRDTTSFGFGF